MFRFEPIYRLNGKNALEVWGYEVLHNNPLIPNPVLFASSNPELEWFLFQRFAEGIHRNEMPVGNLTFNLSPVTFYMHYDDLYLFLSRYEGVYIELTELENGSQYLSMLERVDGWIRRRLILDDFLTRYSSFGIFLKVRPFGVKIEPELFDYLETRRIVSARDVCLIAEKVETSAHYRKALENGFSYFQGYYFSSEVSLSP